MPSRDDTGVPRSFAAKRLDVSPHTVSMWVLRGYEVTVKDEITGESRTEHRRVRTVGWWRGARLYRWGDLVEAEKATRRSGRSRRGATMRRSTTAGSPVGVPA